MDLPSLLIICTVFMGVCVGGAAVWTWLRGADPDLAGPWDPRR